MELQRHGVREGAPCHLRCRQMPLGSGSGTPAQPNVNGTPPAPPLQSGRQSWGGQMPLYCPRPCMARHFRHGSSLCTHAAGSREAAAVEWHAQVKNTHSDAYDPTGLILHGTGQPAALIAAAGSSFCPCQFQSRFLQIHRQPAFGGVAGTAGPVAGMLQGARAGLHSTTCCSRHTSSWFAYAVGTHWACKAGQQEPPGTAASESEATAWPRQEDNNRRELTAGKKARHLACM
jgi:hypothetical protein